MSCKKIIAIGRADKNDLVLQSPAVSSEHALLLVGQDDQHLLVDRNSANGTRVAGVDDGARIKQKMVTELEEIFFGDVCLTVGEIVRLCE